MVLNQVVILENNITMEVVPILVDLAASEASEASEASVEEARGDREVASPVVSQMEELSISAVALGVSRGSDHMQKQTHRPSTTVSLSKFSQRPHTLM